MSEKMPKRNFTKKKKSSIKLSKEATTKQFTSKYQKIKKNTKDNLLAKY